MFDVALTYRDRDRLTTIPLPPGSKKPGAGVKLARWLNRTGPPTVDRLARLFNGHPQNIAGIMGYPSLGAFALDCDTATTFADVGRLLTADGIQTRTIQRPPNGTPHDGGGTFLLRAPGAVKTARRGDLDVKGQGSYIVLPTSTHPGGGVYFDNGLTIFELPDLAALPWLDLKPVQNAPNLPKSALALLAGDAEAVSRYGSRSEAEAAICCALAYAGFTFHRTFELFRAWSGPGKFKDKLDASEKEARRYLYHTWKNAEVFVENNPSPHKTLAQDLRRWATGRPWPGRTGSTDRAVYLAHLEIVERCAGQPHGASVRELGELAGVNWRTAAKANHRLIDAKLLKLVELATVTRPHRFKLLKPVGFVPSGDTPSQSYVMEWGVRVQTVSHDLGRWQGLNKAALEVVIALSQCTDQTATVATLIELTGRGRMTLYRKLKGDSQRGVIGLFQLGIVEPVGRSTWRLVPEYTPDLLDKAAVDLGVAGLGDRQRQRHRQDRIGHRLDLERGQ